MDINVLFEYLLRFMLESSFAIGIAGYIIGMLVLKPSKRIPDEIIPICVIAICIGLAFGTFAIGNRKEITATLVQGILAGGFALVLHQVPKQLMALRAKLKQ